MTPKISRILLIAAIVLLSAVGAPTARPSTAAPPMAQAGDGSLLFVENVGQFDERARFQVRGGSATMWLAEDALWITLVDAPVIETTERPGGQSKVETPQAVNLKLSFVDANPRPRIEPFNRLDSVVHYYRGSDPIQWHTDVPVWGGVRYVDLYPGVDLEISGEDGRFAWRLVCRADASALRNARLRVEGSETVAAQDGYLRLTTAAGDLTLPLLQLFAAEGTPFGLTTTHPTVNGAEVVAPFSTSPISSLSSPSSLLSLQDDASDLLLGTFLGGDAEDRAYAMAVDGDGNIYVTGYTETPTFPTMPGAHDTSLTGTADVFVTKLNATGSDLVYSTFIGGNESSIEEGQDITVVGNTVYISGGTSASDFPTTSGAYSPTGDGGVFAVRLDETGVLDYATYLPFTNSSESTIAVDGAGAIYVAGSTGQPNFPTTEGAYDRTFGYSSDGFVLKLNPAGQGQNDLLYSTYIGGTGGDYHDYISDIAVDGEGVVYAIGDARGDFPTTPGAYDTTFNGTLPPPYSPAPSNAFFFKLDPAGNGAVDLLYSTYLGGTATIVEQGYSIAVDEAGVAYLMGHSGADDFPTTPGAFDTTYDDFGSDAFVSKLDPAGNGAADLLYSTYLGGSFYELFGGQATIAVDEAGDIYVTGRTLSSDFPVTPGAFQSTKTGDIFVTRLRPQGDGEADLIYSTFLGGDTMDYGLDIAVGQGETVYVAGYTNSDDFPTTAGAYDTTFGGGTCGSSSCDDAFVARLSVTPLPLPDLSPSTKSVTPNEATVGQTVTYTLHLVNSGTLSATVAVTDTLPAALIPRGTPTASSGPPPAVVAQTLTWSGSVLTETTVTLTYTAQLTSTTTSTPTVRNTAHINDGVGTVYTRSAFVNWTHVFLPLVLLDAGS